MTQLGHIYDVRINLCRLCLKQSEKFYRTLVTYNRLIGQLLVVVLNCSTQLSISWTPNGVFNF